MRTVPTTKTTAIRYGRGRLFAPVAVPPERIYAPRSIATVNDTRAELERALVGPIDAPPLRDLVGKDDTVALILDDPTRGMPKADMLRAVFDAMPDVPLEKLRVVVAYGKHEHKADWQLGLPPEWLGRVAVVHHDSRDPDQHKPLTHPDDPSLSFLVNRAVAEADVVVGLDAVRPHYFAGFTGGAKSVLPGCGGIESIKANHALRDHPRARLGITNGNAARENQEALAGLLRKFVILNVVTDDAGRLAKAAYGHYINAHRALVPLARELGQVAASKADIVIAGASSPTAINFYQITKAVAPAGKLLKDGGTLILCGPCDDGLSDVETANKVIYEHTLKRYLPETHRCVLVSALSPEETERSFFDPAPSVHSAVRDALQFYGPDATVAVLPNASYMIPILEGEDPSDW